MDSPCLRVKPNPLLISESGVRIGVEVYGGALFNTWFDRDLNMAGRVTCKTCDQNGIENLESLLINFNRGVAVIPSLAIHLDREANKNRTVNPQTQLSPLFQLKTPNKAMEIDSFQQILLDRTKKEHPDIDIQELLDYEMVFIDNQPCALTGIDQEFISGPRLDNLLSCHAGATALSHAEDQATSLLVLTDHEEVGSDTLAGAGGSFLESILYRIAGTRERLLRASAKSFFISCDNAHAVHPAHEYRHDPGHPVYLNKGPVIKINASQRYASDSESSALIRHLCHKEGLCPQTFVMRNDMPCGSTIGPAISSRTGIKTADIGVATLAMHGIREMTGNHDPAMLKKLLKGFFSMDRIPLLSLT